MPTNDATRKLIDSLVACDEQPGEEEMTELRKRLGQKVTRMKRGGRYSLYVCLAGALLMLLGYVSIAVSVDGRQDIAWLTTAGFAVVIIGAIVAVVGCIGLLRFRGFGYVWARHDFQETAITELSLHVQRLSERVDELAKESRNA